MKTGAGNPGSYPNGYAQAASPPGYWRLVSVFRGMLDLISTPGACFRRVREAAAALADVVGDRRPRVPQGF